MIKIARTPPTTPMTISSFSPCGGGSVGIEASENERKENNSSCFLMLRTIIFCGGGVLAISCKTFHHSKMRQKILQGQLWKTIERVLSTIQVLFMKFKKIFPQDTDYKRTRI